MDPEKKAEVIALFKDMGQARRANEPRPNQTLRLGDTMIVNSTIVVCDPAKIAEVLSALGNRKED